MALSFGDRLAHYEVTALIGEGGMGQVYQATDTKLNRQVALKILPEAFATDPDRLARFQREAQVLASLNHPGIAAIYGLEETDDTRALVLELVAGPTLADRIGKGPIPLDEALPIAKQIAEALEAAHEAGVIHRDLKPANIKVREDGTVKVLDFGLAKALDVTTEGDPNQSPTHTAAATQMGVIMGTAPYMSPEQARGKAVDKRADIWAFGCVLYEMLTGRRAFDGQTASDTLASVLTREPDLGALPTGIPPVVRRLLRRCLEKGPKRRLRDVGEGVIQLEETLRGDPDETAIAAEPVRPAGWRQALPLAVSMSAVAVVLTGLAAWSVTRPEPTPLVRFAVSADEMPLHLAEGSSDIAVSPDGAQIAYLTDSTGIGLGGDELHVRPLDQLTSDVLVAEGELNHPFFSPDGQWVGFYERTPPLLKRVSVQGGPVSTICELPGDLRGASWGADDTIVFASADFASGLWRVAAAGGEPEPLTTRDPEQGEVDHRWPEILPGGEAVVFTIIANPVEDSQIAVLSLTTGEQRVVLHGGSYPRYSPTGHLLYGVRGNLWAVGFDLRRLETVGDPVPVLAGVLTKDAGTADYDLSENGSLIYVPGVSAAAEERTMVWVDRRGREELLGAPPAPYESPRISPDGRYVAVDVIESETSYVMIYDLQRDTPTRLTFGPGFSSYPVWSPDGRRVLFTSNRDGRQNIYSMAADGTGPVERLTTTDTLQVPQSWSADGHSLVIMDTLPSGGIDLKLVLFGAENQTEGLIETEFLDVYAEVSPDGGWVAYGSGGEVWVQPFPDVEGGRWQISRDGGRSPMWGPSGQELFFRRSDSGDMMVVTVETESTFDAGNPEFLFAAPYITGQALRNRPWDVASDGRFLMVKEQAATDATETRIHVVLNWDQELLERVPIP